jgi:hypothetical protein
VLLVMFLAWEVALVQHQLDVNHALLDITGLRAIMLVRNALVVVQQNAKLEPKLTVTHVVPANISQEWLVLLVIVLAYHYAKLEDKLIVTHVAQVNISLEPRVPLVIAPVQLHANLEQHLTVIYVFQITFSREQLVIPVAVLA